MKKPTGITVALLSPVLFLVLAFTGTEVNKAYWDWQVRELCEKDGGVTVFETVTLTEEEYKKFGGINGVIPIPNENSSVAYKYPYVSIQEDKVVKEKSPRVVRREFLVYRKYDDKALGKMVTYSRSGGDFPTIIGHPSGFSCRDIANFNLNVERQIFSVK